LFSVEVSEAVEKLDKIYALKGEITQGSVYKELAELKLENCKDVEDYIGKMTTLFKRMALAGNRVNL
jgi:hypothetical protein